MPVPVVKEEFEYDNPVLGSTAEPADSEYGQTLCEVNIVDRKFGQQLFGSMIPIREKDMLRKKAAAESESLLHNPIGVSMRKLDVAVKGLENSFKVSAKSLGAISEGDEDIV